MNISQQDKYAKFQTSKEGYWTFIAYHVNEVISSLGYNIKDRKLTSAMDCKFLSGFCCLTAPEVLGLP